METGEQLLNDKISGWKIRFLQLMYHLCIVCNSTLNCRFPHNKKFPLKFVWKMKCIKIRWYVYCCYKLYKIIIKLHWLNNCDVGQQQDIQINEKNTKLLIKEEILKIKPALQIRGAMCGLFSKRHD